MKNNQGQAQAGRMMDMIERDLDQDRRQIMNVKMITPITRNSGSQLPLSQRLLILLVVVALFAGQIAILVKTGSAADGDEEQYSTYTDRYWEAAAARAEAVTETADKYASYTDRYWAAAAARATDTTKAVNEYASYTDRYWEAAAARTGEATETADEYVSYTDRYWEAAAARNAASAALSSTSN